MLKKAYRKHVLNTFIIGRIVSKMLNLNKRK